MLLTFFCRLLTALRYTGPTGRRTAQGKYGRNCRQERPPLCWGLRFLWFIGCQTVHPLLAASLTKVRDSRTKALTSLVNSRICAHRPPVQAFMFTRTRSAGTLLSRKKAWHLISLRQISRSITPTVKLIRCLRSSASLFFGRAIVVPRLRCSHCVAKNPIFRGISINTLAC